MLSAPTRSRVQVESRAQMSMLPRLKPRCFYDLVIEVRSSARPDPGDMVHPYLRRATHRAGRISSEALRAVLGKTLGVPCSRSRQMQIAIVAPGFTPTADKLRRAMATFRHVGTYTLPQSSSPDGRNGYAREFAERCFRQIEASANTASGEPRSELRAPGLCLPPGSSTTTGGFRAALLNSKPMGFLSAAQWCATRAQHGVEVPTLTSKPRLGRTLELPRPCLRVPPPCGEDRVGGIAERSM